MCLLPGRTEGFESRLSKSHDFHNFLPHTGWWIVGWILKALKPAGKVPKSLSSIFNREEFGALSTTHWHNLGHLRFGCLLHLGTHTIGLKSKWELACPTDFPVASSHSYYTEEGRFYSESSPEVNNQHFCKKLYSFPQSEHFWGSELMSWVQVWPLSHSPSPVMKNSTSIFPLHVHLNIENISAWRTIASLYSCR
jgi:hypothetical protein